MEGRVFTPVRSWGESSQHLQRSSFSTYNSCMLGNTEAPVRGIIRHTTPVIHYCASTLPVTVQYHQGQVLGCNVDQPTVQYLPLPATLQTPAGQLHSAVGLCGLGPWTSSMARLPVRLNIPTTKSLLAVVRDGLKCRDGQEGTQLGPCQPAM
jgi:hypothetical protein